MATTPNRAYPLYDYSYANDIVAIEGALATAVDLDVQALYTAKTSNEAAWATYTSTWGATSGTPTVGSGGGAVKVTTWHKADALVGVKLGMKFGTSGISTGTGSWTFTLPVTAKVTAGQERIPIGRWAAYDDSADKGYGGDVYLSGTTGFKLVMFDATQGPLLKELQNNYPVPAWAPADLITAQFFYEPA